MKFPFFFCFASAFLTVQCQVLDLSYCVFPDPACHPFEALTIVESGTTTPDLAVSFSPADGETNVSTSTAITADFTRVMDATTITAATSAGACGSATVELSTDDFATCTGFTAAGGNTSDQKTFSFTPLAALTDSTTYKIRLRTGVLDASGEALTPISQANGFTNAAPAASPVFYIYTDSLTVSGNRSNRAASSAACATMQTTNYPALTCTNHLAVVSFTGDDLVSAPGNHSLPTGRALTSTGSTQVAPDWTTFLNGPLDVTLQAAGVASTTPTPFYWTQTNTGGSYDATFNCVNNTDGSAGQMGSQGAITTTAGTHIRFAVNQPCDGSTNSAYLMCVCWN